MRGEEDPSENTKCGGKMADNDGGGGGFTRMRGSGEKIN